MWRPPQPRRARGAAVGVVIGAQGQLTAAQLHSTSGYNSGPDRVTGITGSNGMPASCIPTDRKGAFTGTRRTRPPKFKPSSKEGNA